MSAGADLLFVNASQVVTCAGPARARRGREMADIAIAASGTSVAVRGGRVSAIASHAELEREFERATRIDCGGRVLSPGLVDSHTHAVFGKPRFEEQEMRAAGAGYMQIAEQGGGIHSSVRDLRMRSEDDLVAHTRDHIGRLARHGVTTVEIKSGYGLSLEDELKSLRAVARAAESTAMRVVATFLGAHEIPHDFRTRDGGRREYVDLVIREMLPAVAREKLAKFADVFCEPGVFTVDETREILRAARAHGMSVKVHADELEPSGGAELAAELGAVSADHLAAISEAGIQALAHSSTVATLLPGTMFFLGRARQAPARAMIDAGVAVALATDFNPGTSPTPNLPLIMTMGVSTLRMSVAEVVIAATVNGAAALGVADVTGQLAPGFAADLALWDCADVREIPYWYGDCRCVRSWAGGVEVERD